MRQKIFWPLARILDHLEVSLRHKAEQLLYKLPWVWRFKMIKKLMFLDELYRLLAQHKIEAYVVGGFAYDGIRGRLTRPHADIDICLLDDDLPHAIEYLGRHGYRLECYSPYKYRVWKFGLYGDLYVWRRCGYESIEHLTGDKGVRIPKAFFRAGGAVSLSGVEFRIPTIEYMTSALIFMEDDENRRYFHDQDRHYLMTLLRAPIEPPQIGLEEKQVTFAVTMHDFCVDSPSAGSAGSVQGLSLHDRHPRNPAKRTEPPY